MILKPKHTSFNTQSLKEIHSGRETDLIDIGPLKQRSKIKQESEIILIASPYTASVQNMNIYIQNKHVDIFNFKPAMQSEFNYFYLDL